MFSLVLMTAVAGGPDVTAGGPFLGGCYGCYGSSCYGSSCYGGGCYGSSCFGSGCYGGCYGGPAFPLVRAVAGLPFRLVGGVFNAFSCRGSSCYGGGCYGSSCYGSSCYGSSCYGSSCFGCYGSSVYGGCYGSAIASSAAVYGGCYGSGCFGGCHGGGCYGGAIIGADVSVPAVDGLGMVGAATHTAAKLVEPTAAATLTVNLPAEATLYVDGAAVAGNGTVRRFHTPALAPGKTFFYELRAELTVGGKAQPEEMKVIVRSGESREVRFEKLIAAARGSDAGVLAQK